MTHPGGPPQTRAEIGVLSAFVVSAGFAHASPPDFASLGAATTVSDVCDWLSAVEAAAGNAETDAGFPEVSFTAEYFYGHPDGEPRLARRMRYAADGQRRFIETNVIAGGDDIGIDRVVAVQVRGSYGFVLEYPAFGGDPVLARSARRPEEEPAIGASLDAYLNEPLGFRRLFGGPISEGLRQGGWYPVSNVSWTLMTEETGRLSFSFGGDRETAAAASKRNPSDRGAAEAAADRNFVSVRHEVVIAGPPWSLESHRMKIDRTDATATDGWSETAYEYEVVDGRRVPVVGRISTAFRRGASVSRIDYSDWSFDAPDDALFDPETYGLDGHFFDAARTPCWLYWVIGVLLLIVVGYEVQRRRAAA